MPTHLLTRTTWRRRRRSFMFSRAANSGFASLGIQLAMVTLENQLANASATLGIQLALVTSGGATGQARATTFAIRSKP